MHSDLSETLPALACDTHSHVYGNEMRYPLSEGQHIVIDATLDRYLHLAGRFGITRTIFVQPKAYGNDPACMLDAISQLGVQRARGIIMPDDELSQTALNRLDRLGIRGVRFLFQDDNSVNIEHIRATAARIAGLGWSLLVQGSAVTLAPCLPQLAALACPVVIDHLGRLTWHQGVGSTEFTALLRFVGQGGWVKLSAPYYGTRHGEADYAMIESRVRALLDVGEDRTVWGMNWPHPNFEAHNKPDDVSLLSSLLRIVRSPAERNRLFVDNPARLYGFD